MSRGAIVDSGKINGANKTSVSFSVPVSEKMAPKARIIVYYIRTHGEIVADSFSFDVEGDFENQVSMFLFGIDIDMSFNK